MQTWIVTADASASIDALANQLKALGLTIVRVQGVIGTLEVRGSESLALAAGKLPGVANIEKDLAVDIGPDAPAS